MKFVEGRVPLGGDAIGIDLERGLAGLVSEPQRGRVRGKKMDRIGNQAPARLTEIRGGFLGGELRATC